MTPTTPTTTTRWRRRFIPHSLTLHRILTLYRLLYTFMPCALLLVRLDLHHQQRLAASSARYTSYLVHSTTLYCLILPYTTLYLKWWPAPLRRRWRCHFQDVILPYTTLYYLILEVVATSRTLYLTPSHYFFTLYFLTLEYGAIADMEEDEGSMKCKV